MKKVCEHLNIDNFDAEIKSVGQVNFFLRHKLLIACLICFVLSMLALFVNNYFFIAYMCFVAICAFFLNPNEIVILSSFGVFFAKCFGHNIFVLTLILPLLIQILIKIIHKKINLKLNMVLPIVIITVFSLMLILNNFNQNNMFRTFLPLILFFSLEIYLLRDEFDLVFLVKNLTFVMVFSYIVAFILYGLNTGIKIYHVDVGKIKRFYALMSHFNPVSIWCVALLSHLILFFKQKKIRDWEFYLYATCLLIIGCLTLSKTFMLLGMLLLLAYLIIATKRNLKLGLLQIGLIICAGVIICLCLPDVINSIRERFIGYKGNYLFDSITTGRSKLWHQGLVAWISNFSTIIWGVGGSYKLNLHNSYLEILVKYGIIGVLLVITFIVYFVIRLKKNVVWKISNLIPIVAMLLYMLVEEFSTGQFVTIILSLLAIYSFNQSEEVKMVTDVTG